VLEDGKRIRVEEGTPQGGSASPLLANVYLHYVFDLWVRRGVRSARTAMSSSCDSQTTSWLDSGIERMPISSSRTHRTNEEVQPGTCIPKRRGCWSSVRMRSTNGSGVEKETGDVQLPWLYAHLRKEEE